MLKVYVDIAMQDEIPCVVQHVYYVAWPGREGSCECHHRHLYIDLYMAARYFRVAYS